MTERKTGKAGTQFWKINNTFWNCSFQCSRIDANTRRPNLHVEYFHLKSIPIIKMCDKAKAKVNRLIWCISAHEIYTLQCLKDWQYFLCWWTLTLHPQFLFPFLTSAVSYVCIIEKVFFLQFLLRWKGLLPSTLISLNRVLFLKIRIALKRSFFLVLHLCEMFMTFFHA